MNYSYKPTVKKRLTKKNLEALVDDYSLLKWYVPEFKGYPTTMRSNIRFGGKDKDASLSIICSNNRAIISDFGSANTGMNIWNYLILLLGYSDTRVGFLSLLERVRSDFNLDLEPYTGAVTKVYQKPQNTPIIYHSKHEDTEAWEIRYRSRPMGSWKCDARFWKDESNIGSGLLQRCNVKALESFMLVRGNQQITFVANEDSPSYAYVPLPETGISGWKRKIYSPRETGDRKWFNTLPKTACLLEPLLPKTGKVLFIETSMKDAMCLLEMFEGEDIWAIEVSSESAFITPELYSELQVRFDLIIYHGDNDEPGIRQAALFTETYGVVSFTNPVNAPKDTTEMRREWGLDRTKKMFYKIIDEHELES